MRVILSAAASRGNSEGQPRIGAHLSASGGLLNVVERAREREAEAVQIFPSNSRRWRPHRYSLEELLDFRLALQQADLPLYVHAIYLVNLAAPDSEVRRSSAAALAHALYFGTLAGARAVVTHVGSHKGEGFEKGLERVILSVTEAEDLARQTLGRLEDSWQDAGAPALRELPALLLESSAGSKNTLGRNVQELALLLGAVDFERTGICLDTAHLYAAGIPLHTEQGLEELAAEVQRHIGWERLGLVHLNDCRTAFGSMHDQHSNLGEGNLGTEGLGRFLRHPYFRRVPFILEVPGVEDKGPDLENVRRAQALRTASAPRATSGAPRARPRG